ncbi:hypothetical protein BCIN_12g05490 [Botrytis cinerea B05.10]|uniref:SRR1-like domain-containing protein n=1 Tax=Botryotinia fuckeliana (strain B05.10) TaxID=332648 RepID=A0A384JZI3_BOTFB|nr:hypothetical protein BCIN_12g05490 [Botrytis cinerea B05.10]ATZ56009.1 hypothetical protein BCIN_12g05490 [Botrytis cinerea B05.10]
MTTLSDKRKFSGMDIRLVTDIHEDNNSKTFDMHSPAESGISKDMEMKVFGDSQITPLTDTPTTPLKDTSTASLKDKSTAPLINTLTTESKDTSFTPPTGHWDIGDTIRYGDKKWMILRNDHKWHEHEGPEEYMLENFDIKKIEFFREQEICMGSGEEFIIGKSWTGYRHFEESTLDAIFEKYKLGSEDETKLKKLVKSIMKGKVKPTNVACFALGSFHRLYNEPKRSFEQFAVLLKLMEILEISPNARNVMQDPEFSPADARFFAKHGFETVLDPEGFNSINQETLVVQIGGYGFLDERAMEGHWPAVYIKMGFPFITGGHILDNRSLFEKQIWERLNDRERGSFKSLFEKEKVKAWWEYKMRRAFMKRSYSYKDIPKVGICDSMAFTQLFWRKTAVGERSRCIEMAGGIARAALQLLKDTAYYVWLIRHKPEFTEEEEEEEEDDDF